MSHTIKTNSVYYLTLTVVEWADVFTRKENRDIIIDSFRHCIKHKGLNVYAYCIMSNHIHMVVNCKEPFQLKDTIRDFKKHTAKENLKLINTNKESRRIWLLDLFESNAMKSKKHKRYKFWKGGNHAIELIKPNFTWQKIEYIHQNPVKAGLVSKATDWIYSSALNYADEEAILEEVICVSAKQITF